MIGRHIRRTTNRAVMLLLLAASSVLAAEPVSVTVNCSQKLEKSPQLWGHVNVSRRVPPPKELCSLVEKEFGRPQVTRCWLMLDEMWDYRTDAYRFNYEINKDYYADDAQKPKYGVVGEVTGVQFYDYLDSVAKHSESVLLNVRRYEQEVLAGALGIDKWKEVFKAGVRHYKQRSPNLRFIEVLNEPTAKNQSNIGSMANYYRFYRCAYEAINELNAEMRPEMPLLVGGTAGLRLKEAFPLITEFAQDKQADKRLDFISFHHYWLKNPAEVATWEPQIDGTLREAGLPTNIPILVTEIGYTEEWKADPAKNLWQAAGMTAFQYYARYADDLRLFPWVQYHSGKQASFIQFDSDLKMTPYGASVKMLRLHRTHEVQSVSSGLDKDGHGVGSLATLNGSGLTVQIWNVRPDSQGNVKVNVSIASLPKEFRSTPLRVRRYLIDSTHSNCIGVPSFPGGLEKMEEATITANDPLVFSAELEPMALCLWSIEPK